MIVADPIAQVVEDLLENRSLTEADLALLQQTIVEGDNQVLLEQLQAQRKTLDPCLPRDDVSGPPCSSIVKQWHKCPVFVNYPSYYDHFPGPLCIQAWH